MKAVRNLLPWDGLVRAYTDLARLGRLRLEMHELYRRAALRMGAPDHVGEAARPGDPASNEGVSLDVAPGGPGPLLENSFAMADVARSNVGASGFSAAAAAQAQAASPHGLRIFDRWVTEEPECLDPENVGENDDVCNANE